MPANKKLAIFDFDGTIYKHQSPDIFADYVAKNNARTKLLQSICEKLIKKPKYSGLVHKKVKLFKIKGTSAEYLEKKAIEFVNTEILNNLIDVVEKDLLNYINNPEFDVVIASAGYNIYLDYFCKVMNIPLCVATNIEMINGVASGKMAGYDCIRQEKVTRLKKILNFKDYDLENSVCYSDSMTDKPIFELVGKKFYVKKLGDRYSIIHINNEVFVIFQD